MGGGSWTSSSYVSHSTKSRGFSDMASFKSASAQELYRSKNLDASLNPYKVVRECCDSEEHPETIPVILALDVTGSMGAAAEAVAKQLNDIMDNLYGEVKDVEFAIMAIGDFSYDHAPLQVSQFESDIRIAEALEKVYFERGGGGNSWESYTAAWYFGLNNTKLDCWNRGRKGIIITLGDEPLNPYLPKDVVRRVIGNSVQGDVETNDLFSEVKEKFDIYHIAIDDPETAYRHYATKIDNTFGRLLGDNFKVSTCNNLACTISDIIKNSSNKDESLVNTTKTEETYKYSENGISW